MHMLMILCSYDLAKVLADLDFGPAFHQYTFARSLVETLMSFLWAKLHMWIHVLTRVLDSPRSHHLCMPSNENAVEQDQGATEPLLSHLMFETLERADVGMCEQQDGHETLCLRA